MRKIKVRKTIGILTISVMLCGVMCGFSQNDAAKTDYSEDSLWAYNGTDSSSQADLFSYRTHHLCRR